MGELVGVGARFAGSDAGKFVAWFVCDGVGVAAYNPGAREKATARERSLSDFITLTEWITAPIERTGPTQVRS